MAGEEVDLEKVKRIVRAILLSSKHGRTTRQLLSDYDQTIGSRLPYQELGYTSLVQFVESMPDVVRVSRNRGNTILHGVPDVSTEQISRMVSKQRASKKPPFPATEARWGSPTPSAPVAPLTFSIQLRMLMLAYPGGLEVDKFQEAFARRFNFHLSHRQWAFESLEQLLKSVPDVVRYEWDGYRKTYIIKQVPKVPQGAQTMNAPRQPQGSNRGPRQREYYYNPVVPPLPSSPKSFGKNCGILCLSVCTCTFAV